MPIVAPAVSASLDVLPRLPPTFASPVTITKRHNRDQMINTHLASFFISGYLLSFCAKHDFREPDLLNWDFVFVISIA